MLLRRQARTAVQLQDDKTLWYGQEDGAWFLVYRA